MTTSATGRSRRAGGGAGRTGGGSARTQAQTAPRGSRFRAMLIDALVLGLSATVIQTGTVVATVGAPSDGADVAVSQSAATVNVLVAALLAAGMLCYYGLLDGVRGQTVGKRVCHVRLVDEAAGTPIGFARAIARRIVLGLTGLLVFIGYASILFDPSGQDRGWHDKAVRSRVIAA